MSDRSEKEARNFECDQGHKWSCWYDCGELFPGTNWPMWAGGDTGHFSVWRKCVKCEHEELHKFDATDECELPTVPVPLDMGGPETPNVEGEEAVS